MKIFDQSNTKNSKKFHFFKDVHQSGFNFKLVGLVLKRIFSSSPPTIGAAAALEHGEITPRVAPTPGTECITHGAGENSVQKYAR